MKNWKTLLLGIAMIANTSFAAPQVVDKVAAGASIMALFLKATSMA